MEILCALNYYPKFLVATIIGLRTVFLFCPLCSLRQSPARFQWSKPHYFSCKWCVPQSWLLSDSTDPVPCIVSQRYGSISHISNVNICILPTTLLNVYSSCIFFCVHNFSTSWKFVQSLLSWNFNDHFLKELRQVKPLILSKYSSTNGILRTNWFISWCICNSFDIWCLHVHRVNIYFN